MFAEAAQMLILLDVGFPVVTYLNKDYFISSLSLMCPEKWVFHTSLIPCPLTPHMQGYLSI